MNGGAAFILLILLLACCRAGLAQTGESRVERVIIAFKTHFDIGYTDLASNVVRRYRTTMIDQALQVCDQSRDLPTEQQFVWTIPGWPMKKITEDWEGQTPERKQRILQAFKTGRFAVHALPFSTHTELLELEDLVRGLGYAAQLSRSAGLELPRDAKMTDVPCHAWIMPSLLKHAGVDFLHLGCNAASRSPEVPVLFWWEGPDGSRLLTMYSAEGYGTGLVAPKGWLYKTWLALVHTGDNHGPPTPEEVKQLLAEAKVKLPQVQVQIGRLSDFADAILAEKAKLPVIRGDMPDTWIHGPMCDPAGAKIARNIRPAIATAELLDTQLHAWGVPAPEATRAIATAYENSLLYGEHTWGGALYWVTSYSQGRQFNYGPTWRAERGRGRFDRLESSWAEHTSYIETAEKLVTPLLNQQLQALSQAVSIEGQRIVVFNSLPWKRGGLVTMESGRLGLDSLTPSDGGDTVPVTWQDGHLYFEASDVPALGYRTYVPSRESVKSDDLIADRSAATIENRFFKAALDPQRGTIRSLIEKRTGRELVEAGGERGFGQYLYERFDADQVANYVKAYVKINADWATNELGKPALPPASQVPYRPTSPNQFKVRLERTPAMLTAVMDSVAGLGLNPSATSTPDHLVTTKFSLYRDQPYLDLEIAVRNKPADPWPEAGWICLPLKVSTPRFRLERQASIVDPATDIVPGANHHLIGINTGVAVIDPQGQGVGICPLDNPLVSLEVPGCWRYSRDFVPQKPVVWINLFNNQWTTNFRLWNEGTWTSRVRIWPIGQYDSGDDLIDPALEARNPLRAAWAEGPAGKLSTKRGGLELSRKGVMVTAFGPSPDGRGTLLRLWELAGKSEVCHVRLPVEMAWGTIQPVDLRGQPLGRPLKTSGTFAAELSAFAPASYLLLP
jgi:alpha-mannosidase